MFLILIAVALTTGYFFFVSGGSEQVFKLEDLPVTVKPLVEKETAGYKIIEGNAHENVKN